MSPKEPLPIFRPSRYLFPTLSSMVVSCLCHAQKYRWLWHMTPCQLICSAPIFHHYKTNIAGWATSKCNRTIQDGLLDFSEWLMEERCPRGPFSCSHDLSARDTLNHVLMWVLPKQDWMISNSCLASRDTWLGLGGGGWLKWNQREQRREEKEKQPNQGLQKCKMSLRNWDQLQHEYNNLAHTKRNEVHHLSCAARDAVPRSSFIKYSLHHATLCSHCKSKTKLSAVLWSTAKGGKAWAATELCPALSVSRPSDNFVQWTSSKVLQRNLQHWASFIKEMCFPATNL